MDSVLKQAQNGKWLIIWTLWSLVYANSKAYLNLDALLMGGVIVWLMWLDWTKPMQLSWQKAIYMCFPIAGISLLFSAPNGAYNLGILPLLVVGIMLVLRQERALWRYIGLGTLGVAFGLALVSQWHWGTDNIDVFSITQQGALDFWHGLNPYHMFYRSTTMGVHAFRYDYGPLWLPMTVPFALLGDVRLLMVLSAIGIVALGVKCSGWRTPGTWLWVSLLVLSPWLYLPILESWTELVMVLLFLLWYELRSRYSWAWLLLAVALGANPVIGIVLLPMFLVMPKTRRDMFYAGGLAAVCWLAAAGLSGHDFVKAFEIAGTQKYPPTISVAGLYGTITHQAWPRLASLVLILGSSVWVWCHRQGDLRKQEFLIAIGSTAIVWSLPGGYFEYALIPAIWWWWLLRTPPEAEAIDAAA